MSSIPSNVSRSPTLLVNQIQLANIQRSSLGLFETQSQLATGRTILRPSDDPVSTAAVAQLDDSIQRTGQRLRNIDQADANLSLIETSLAEANDLLLSAKSVASTQVNIGSTQAERDNQAAVVNSLIDGLLTQMNRKSVDNYLFGGSKTGAPPFETFGAGFVYKGEFDQLTTDINLGRSVPVTLVGIESLSSELNTVKGDVDLSPAITPETLLKDLRSAHGLGITTGPIQMQFESGPIVQVDLTTADTVEDVTTRISSAIEQYETQNGVTILGPGGVGLSSEGFSIDVVPGTAPAADPQLTFTELGAGTTARDLGLTTNAGSAFEATQPDGLGLDPKLTMASSITSLTGLAGALDEIVINNGGRRAQIDLSSAETIEDLKNAIQAADIGARLVINSQGTGIDIVNLVSAAPDQSLTIEEVPGGNRTAELLGIRSLKASTRTDTFNDGRGVSVQSGRTDPITGLADPALDVDFAITLGDGSSFTVNLRPEDIVTTGDVITRINEEALSQGIPATAFQAGLGDGANGIQFTQDATFTDAITIEKRNNSTAMEELGFSDAAYDAGSATLAGVDPAPVVSNTVFTRLIQLREALTGNDSTGITFAGTKLEDVVDSVAQTRGLVGSYSKRLETARVREEDVNVMEQSFRSELRDLDFAEASTKLSLLQTQLQAGLQSMTIANQLSLLDFLGQEPGRGLKRNTIPPSRPRGIASQRSRRGTPAGQEKPRPKVKDDRMEVQTSRFGVIEIAEDRVITFSKGLLGFPSMCRYCLLQPGDDAMFFWLQSLDDPELAFVITDPTMFYPEYAVPIRSEQMETLSLEKLEDAQVFVIVNKVEQQLTGNLQGPLVVNTLERTGEQLILADKRWTTRQPLMKVGTAAQAASA